MVPKGDISTRWSCGPPRRKTFHQESRIDSLHAMELELAHTKDRVGYRRYLGRSAEAGDVALDAA
jgi:hypothetical protein